MDLCGSICSREWYPELELPPLGAEDRRLLVEQICHGAISYKEIKERHVWPTVKSWLSPAQQSSSTNTRPSGCELPNGRKVKITYAANAAPTIAARIQDLYGVEGELRIAGDRIPLVIQVLAPNQRPIQITQNLANFWKESTRKSNRSCSANIRSTSGDERLLEINRLRHRAGR